MYYIRTIKNNYDIDVVIDVTDNTDFVQTSGLEWIEIGNTQSENGNYYYDGKIISVDSEDYVIIENIIKEYEEPARLERERLEKEFEENTQKEIQEFFENQLLENTTDDTAPEPPDPLDADAIAAAEAAGAVDPRNFTTPKAYPILGVQSTESNFRDWERNYKNISFLINSLNSENPTVVNNVAIFDPELEFPDGHKQSNFPFPEDDINGYIQHLIAVRQTYRDLLDTICTDLNLPPIPEE
jgi:hypothetical protein